MRYYLEHPEIFNSPILLSEEEHKTPEAVLRRFFTDYNLSELREFLSEMQETCLTTDNPPFDQPSKRADLILFCRNIELQFEAAFLLMKEVK